MLLLLGTLVDMAPSILISTPILLPVMLKLGVDPVHFGMIMMLNLGIGLCHPPVGAILFVGCAVGDVTIEQVLRRIWPFYGVMFAVLMLVTYLPRCRCGCRGCSDCDAALCWEGTRIKRGVGGGNRFSGSCLLRRRGSTAASASITGRAKYRNTRNSAPIKHGTAAA